MPLNNIQLSFTSINVSIQVGDNVYFTLPSSANTVGGFNTAELNNTYLLGVVVSILAGAVIVEYNDDPPHPGAPPVNSFISFAKNKTINTSSVLGYYASVKFVNNSKKNNVELFSVGAEISQSSK